MKGKPARLMFLGVCAVLAILLLTRIITPVIGSLIFAVALIVFGGLSGGFRRT